MANHSPMYKKALIIISGVSLLLSIWESLRIIVSPIIALPSLFGGNTSAGTLLLVLFSIANALYVLGWRHTLVFFVTSAVISWACEEVGVASGVLFGAYHYTDALGFKLGLVPVMIPLAWFMMIYPGYVVANLITRGEPTGSPRNIGGLLWVSLMSAAVMTAWDLLIDPILSGPAVAAWVWENGGPYFGIPLRNYFGWMVTTFTVYFVYRFFERGVPIRPAGRVSPLIAAMPLFAYGSVFLSNSFGEGPAALRVIGPFAMGIPFALAVAAWGKWKGSPGDPS
jgi:uncharacterized membrane protein